MDAPHRGALMLVRFTAAGLMGVSVVELALDWAEFKYRQVPVNAWLDALWGVVFLAGVVMVFIAKSIANWISEKLE
jgi:hypothetical protein